MSFSLLDFRSNWLVGGNCEFFVARNENKQNSIGGVAGDLPPLERVVRNEVRTRERLLPFVNIEKNFKNVPKNFRNLPVKVYIYSMSNFKPNVRELTMKHGLSYPSDTELVMMILGSGTKDISVAQLSKSVVNKIYESNNDDIIQNLLSIRGMGKGKALAIAAAIEFGRRRNCHHNAKIINPCDVIPFVRSYSLNSQEHFICITLNGGHEIMQVRVVSVGTIDKTIVHPRELFSEALKENAAAIIVCHNHPSGDCRPSEEDIVTTETLIEASHILGIALLDHIIFDKTNYFSFVEHGLLFA